MIAGTPETLIDVINVKNLPKKEGKKRAQICFVVRKPEMSINSFVEKSVIISALQRNKKKVSSVNSYVEKSVITSALQRSKKNVY